jgi:NADPH2:quinone reductase
MRHPSGSNMTSRAARLHAPDCFRTELLELREPAAGEVRVRLEGCGVCASNLPLWQGRPWFSYPLNPGAPGHEGWGAIDAIGPAVTGFSTGERVALISQHAYAEHDFATTDSVVKLPAGLAGRPFPGEPLACAMNILRRSQIEAGQTVAVVGIGFLGAVVSMLAARAGAYVVALSRRPFALQVAERLGASAVLGLEEPGRALRDAWRLSGNKGYERVIECVGSQDALDLASELAGTRARLVIAGYHQDGERRVNLQQWNWRGLDVVNAHERDPSEYRRGMREAIDLAVRADLDLSALLTHQFPLADAAAAFDALARRPDGFLKALIVCQ